MARFDDSVLRNDHETFRSPWTEDGVWEISPPVPMRAVGKDAIFFRSPTMELARREGRLGYENMAIYYDEAVRVAGRWFFARRYYQYLWVDLKSALKGETVHLSKRDSVGPSASGEARA